MTPKPKRVRKKATKIERGSNLDGYSVECDHCGQEFGVDIYPEYCVVCGEELERERGQ